MKYSIKLLLTLSTLSSSSAFNVLPSSSSPHFLTQATKRNHKCHHPWSLSRPSLTRNDNAQQYASSSDQEVLESSITDSTPSSETTTSKTAKLIQNLFDAYMNRDFTSAIDSFSDTSFSYEDTMYIGAIANNKDELLNHFYNGVSLLPKDASIVVDEIAANDEDGKVGVEWHLERSNGEVIPFSRGCSFYTIDAEEGKIVEGFKVVEMLVKTDKRVADALVSNVSRFSGVAESLVKKLQQQTSDDGNDSEEVKIQKKEEDGDDDSSLSIIEKYYKAWNERDMELALSYFDNDCVVRTEDPVFVGTINGKEELKSHLLQNAESLPTSAKIILDDVAVDESNGNYGVRWHLEVNGYSLPGLRGCSMCTSDLESGLLKSCFDVTEAPVKLPRAKGRLFTRLLSVPSKLLLNA